MKKYYYILCCLIISIQAISQITVNFENAEINATKSGISYVLDSVDHFEGATSKELLSKKWTELSGKRIKLNKLPLSLWLKIPLKNIVSYGDFQFLKINNPHINFLECWIVNDTAVLKKFRRTGDNLPFQTRTIPITSFDFPINSVAYPNCYLLIMADKRFTNLAMPIQFCTEPFYISSTQNQNTKIGAIVGLCLFLLSLNLVLYFFIKQNLFLWYGLFLLCILIYLLADFGILFKAVYPNIPFLNDLMRPFSLSIGIVPLNLFFSNILDLETNFPRLYRINKLVLSYFLPLFAISLISAALGSYFVQGIWLQVFRVLGPSLMLVLVAESFYCTYKGNLFAKFSLLSFSGTTLFFIVYSLQQNEFIKSNWFTSNTNYVAFFWEFLIMSIAIAWRYKYYKQESELQLQKNRDQQERILKETAAYQEKEMQNISSMLHDSVGASLGLLRLESDNMELNEAARKQLSNNITKIGNQVREMSHLFSPILLQEKGLYASIGELLNRITKHSDLDIQFEWVGEKAGISSSFEILLYRIIQEVIQNIIKHSNAENAFLQIIVEQTFISIYAENDGILVKQMDREEGIGLKNIEKLISLLNGQIQINNNENDCYSISIDFNLNEYA